jgi:hypothetical protein
MSADVVASVNNRENGWVKRWMGSLPAGLTQIVLTVQPKHSTNPNLARELGRWSEASIQVALDAIGLVEDHTRESRCSTEGWLRAYEGDTMLTQKLILREYVPLDAMEHGGPVDGTNVLMTGDPQSMVQLAQAHLERQSKHYHEATREVMGMLKDVAKSLTDANRMLSDGYQESRVREDGERQLRIKAEADLAMATALIEVLQAQGPNGAQSAAEQRVAEVQKNIVETVVPHMPELFKALLTFAMRQAPANAQASAPAAAAATAQTVVETVGQAVAAAG